MYLVIGGKYRYYSCLPDIEVGTSYIRYTCSDQIGIRYLVGGTFTFKYRGGRAERAE